MSNSSAKPRVVVVKIESYEGEDTFMRCGSDRQDFLYAIVAVDLDGSAEIVDSSYRTLNEALSAWPQAAPRSESTTRGD